MSHPSLESLNTRSVDIFRRVVEAYLNGGAPVGARLLSRDMALSPATIRNVMSDLEDMGLLFAPHTSAGRLPTEAGLRLFVDGLLEVGDITAKERSAISEQLAGTESSPEDVLMQATDLLSGLSRCAGLVAAPHVNARLSHMEFTPLGEARTLVVIVSEGGAVENRVIETPKGFSPSALEEAANYLNRRLKGLTLTEARTRISRAREADKAALDALTAHIVEAGLAAWSGAEDDKALIVRGTANLLDDVHALEDLERIRKLFDDLERKTDVLHLMELAEKADGVRIFIGAETKLFSLSGSSLVVRAYRDSESRIVGALGVIGPKRLNYARIIPMVDYTAKLVGRILSAPQADTKQVRRRGRAHR